MKAESALDDALGVEMVAEPAELTMSERRSFALTLSATNRGGEVVDPELHQAHLLVNGHEPKVWSLAIANGKRLPEWFALPPGETVSMTWSSMGRSLFPRPGTFALALRLRDVELGPIEVHVLAEDRT